MTVRHARDLNNENWDQCDFIWHFAEFFDPESGYCAEPPSERKCRLVMVAAFRAIWDHIHDPRCRAAVEAAERFADEPDPTILAQVRESVELAIEDAQFDEENWPDKQHSYFVAHTVCDVIRLPPPLLVDIDSPRDSWAQPLEDLQHPCIPGRTEEEATALHFRLLHDIFRNPFRPVTFSPSWRTDTALQLAKQMYESRDFSLMPILADALQDAGWDNEEMLHHCRDTSLMHVRGCWVVDLVLGKE